MQARAPENREDHRQQGVVIFWKTGVVPLEDRLHALHKEESLQLGQLITGKALPWLSAISPGGSGVGRSATLLATWSKPSGRYQPSGG